MHPDVLRALAKARHEDLLEHRTSRQAHSISIHPSDRAPRRPRVRQRVGSVLIWAGARLIGERPPELELTHQ
jgi:hypothetical protein